MPRTIRKIGRTGWAHIILRGINREDLFFDDDDYQRFASTIARYQRELKFEIAAGCLMSNHVHLLLYSEDRDYAQIIKKITVSYAIYYNQKYDRVGHVYQDRFRSEPVDDDGYLLTVARYIYRNPSKAGICAPGDYKYTYIDKEGILSSYFGDEQRLMEFLDTENEDTCLDYDTEPGMNDAELISRLRKESGIESPLAIQQLSKQERNRILKLLKNNGASVRQISRVTGINRNIVQRA